MEVAPNPAQRRFLDALKPNSTTLLCSGVGVGKTWVLSFAALHLALLNPGVNGLIVSHHLQHIRTEIIPNVIGWLKAAGIFAGETRMDRLIHLTTGGAIQWGSAEKPESLDGKNVGWLLGDEIRYWPRASHDRAVARVRVKAALHPCIGFVTTPELNWIYDEFADRDDRVVVHGATSENPHLQPGYVERLRESLSPSVFEQYVEGRWVSTSGSVYSEELGAETFCELEPHPHLPVIMGMDPGVTAPAIVFGQVLPWCTQHGVEDCLHLIDELVPDETPLVRMVPLIKDRAHRKGYTLGALYLDPFGGNAREQVYGTTVAERLEMAGFEVVYSYEPSTTNILNGVDVVRSRILNSSGQRRLFVAKDLEASANSNRHLARALNNYRWPERKPGQPAKSNPIHDETSHIMDALRYICANLWPHGFAPTRIA